MLIDLEHIWSYTQLSRAAVLNNKPVLATSSQQTLRFKRKGNQQNRHYRKVTNKTITNSSCRLVWRKTCPYYLKESNFLDHRTEKWLMCFWGSPNWEFCNDVFGSGTFISCLSGFEPRPPAPEANPMSLSQPSLCFLLTTHTKQMSIRKPSWNFWPKAILNL